MFAEKIKQIRKALNIKSVNELAEQIDIPYRTIESYEAGREPSIKFLTRMCGKYNLNANWFISGKGEMFNIAQNEPNNDELAQRVRQILREEGVIK